MPSAKSKAIGELESIIHEDGLQNPWFGSKRER